MLVRALILCLPLITSVSGAAEPEVTAPPSSSWRFDLGVGAAARWRREVNPQFGEWSKSAQLFATTWYRRFGLTLELGREPSRASRSGGLSIVTEGTHYGAWGRYGYARWSGVTPYVSLGGGATVDTIRTTFQSTTDQRRGSRRYLGLGAGFSTTLYTYLLVEGEARVISEETVKFPGVTFLFRFGVSY